MSSPVPRWDFLTTFFRPNAFVRGWMAEGMNELTEAGRGRQAELSRGRLRGHDSAELDRRGGLVERQTFRGRCGIDICFPIQLLSTCHVGTEQRRAPWLSPN